MSFIASVLSFSILLFFMNDLRGLLSVSKWDGLLYFLCNQSCLILIDQICIILFGITFVLIASHTIKRYKWKFLFVPILGMLVWLILTLAYILVMDTFFMWPQLLWHELSWGISRVWLEPSNKTNTYGRDNFSIHGGWWPGSAGCIDLTGQIDKFTNWFENNGLDLILSVKYNQWNTWRRYYIFWHYWYYWAYQLSQC